MGCQQSTIASYATTSTVYETTCRSTYGPRQLTSIPTTTRTTTSNIVSVERPLEWSTSCTYVTVPDTYTEERFIVVTETAPRTAGIPTSTGITYVSSTVTETVSETITQTVTASSTTTVTLEPYTVPAPLGFTPVAPNPANAGADTFPAAAAGVPSTTTATQNEARMTSATDDTIDPTTVVPPGRLLLAAGLHVRAEKSFSNVNRVICDETTRYYTTSVKPFTVRHSYLTSTVTRTNYGTYTIVYKDTVSTETEFPVVYEETTEIKQITDVTTSLAYETTTFTPTYELPRSTVYAACGADNFLGGIAGYGIVGLHLEPRDRTGVTTPTFPADSARTCCEACFSQTDRTCAGSVWLAGTCFFVRNDERCDGSEAMISFDLSRNREVTPNDQLLLSNGACGQEVWSGRYCDGLTGNCGADPMPTEPAPAPTEV